MSKADQYLIPYDKDGSVPRKPSRWSRKNYEYSNARHVRATLEFHTYFWSGRGVSGVFMKDVDTGATYPVTISNFLTYFMPVMFKNNGLITGLFKVSKQGPVYTLKVQELDPCMKPSR